MRPSGTLQEWEEQQGPANVHNRSVLAAVIRQFVTAMGCFVALAGCTNDPIAPVQSKRLHLGGIHLGDTLEGLKAAHPRISCESGGPDAQAGTETCDVSIMVSGRSVPMRVSLAGNRVAAVFRENIGWRDLSAIRSEALDRFGQPWVKQEFENVTINRWLLADEALQIFDGGSSVVLKSVDTQSKRVRPPDQGWTVAAPDRPTMDCRSAPLTVKGLCIGMPWQHAGDELGRRLPHVTLTLTTQMPSTHSLVGDGVAIEAKYGRVTGISIGGPALDELFEAEQLSPREFAESFVAGYKIGKLHLVPNGPPPRGWEFEYRQSGVLLWLGAEAKSVVIVSVGNPSSHHFD